MSGMTANLSHKHDGLRKMRWGDPVGRICYASCSSCFPFFEGVQSTGGSRHWSLETKALDV